MDRINVEDKPRYPKLTDWENEPSVYSLQYDFEQSKGYHDYQVSKITKWNDLLTTSGSEKYQSRSKQRSSIQPKLIKKQAEWRYPALTEPFLNSSKIFKVEPRTFEDLESAKQNELLLNYQFDTKIDKVKFIDELVKSVVNDGTAIVQVGWTRETEQVVELAPVYEYYPLDPMNTEFAQQLEQAMQLQIQNPKQYLETISQDIQESINFTKEKGIPTRAVKVGEHPIQVDKVIENKPELELLNPYNVYVDPSCNGDINKALFIVVSFETNRASLEKTGIYKNLDKINWLGGTVENGVHVSESPSEFSFADAPRRKTVAYEYWGYYDIHGNNTLVPIVATWIDDVLIRLEENPFPDKKLPFVFIRYLPVVHSLYGEPDAEVLGDNQRILGAITRGMIDLLGRSANGQQGFVKGMLDTINKRKFQAGEDYEFNPTTNPATGYIEHTYKEIPQTAIILTQMLNQEAEALTGVKSFSGGLSGDTYGQVASGIRGVLDASAKREMAILRRIAKGVSEIGNKIIAMNAVFLSETEVVRVTNSEFISIKREDIKGNFDLKVDINTAEIDNAKAQDLGFMLQTIGPNLDPQITLFILSEIAELKRMPTLANRLKNYQPQPDPIEEQKKQLEVQKLQSEIGLNNARASLANAQAQDTSVDTMLTATGVKHSQEMDKQKAQASANQNLEVTKALTKSLKDKERAPDINAAIGFNYLTDPERN